MVNFTVLCGQNVVECIQKIFKTLTIIVIVIILLKQKRLSLLEQKKKHLSLMHTTELTAIVQASNNLFYTGE